MEVAVGRQFALQKFYQLAKVDEVTHRVSGFVTNSKPDKEDETANYKATKKAYQTWSKEASTNTEKAGQDISFGNIRIQHSDDVGGKAVDIVYDDENESVWIETEPIDEEMFNLIKKGYYTGFSQGGDYAFRVCKECGTTVPKKKGNYCDDCKKVVSIEYGPIISEVSYVDNPCHGDAHFDLVKADGTHEMVKFQKGSTGNMDQDTKDEIAALVKTTIAEALKKESKTKRVAGEDLGPDCFAYVGDKDDTSTWKLPIKFSTEAKTKSHVRNALARFNQTQGIPAGEKAKVKAKITAAAKKCGIDVSEDEAKKSTPFKELLKNTIEQMVADRLPEDLSKDMYGVARLAGMISDLSYILWSTQYEAEIEQDNSELPAELQENLEQLVETFLHMAEEETDELTAATAERIGKVMKVTPTGLEKAYSKAAGIINKMKKAVKDHHDAVTAAGEEHVEKMHGHLQELKDCMNCDKDVGEKTKKSYTGEELQKAIDEAVARVKKGDIPKTKAGHQETESTIDDQEEGELEPEDPSDEGTENIAQKTYSQADMDKAVNLAIQTMVKAMKGDDEDEEEEEPKKKTKKAAAASEDDEDEEEEPKKKTKKSSGIGNRSESSQRGPVIKTMPVSKEGDDNRMVKAAGGAETEGDVSPETVRKALANGDVNAQLTLMKSAKPNSEVPSTLHGAVGRLGRSRG